uniref:Uncharacterized protein n=1 Tax=Glossina austeni TaxID=7395 RepID=A0A1A9VR90_GLOAU
MNMYISCLNGVTLFCSLTHHNYRIVVIVRIHVTYIPLTVAHERPGDTCDIYDRPKVIKMRVDNHTPIRHVLLHHFEKAQQAMHSFRDLDTLQSAQVNARDSSPASHLATLAWEINQ